MRKLFFLLYSLSFCLMMTGQTRHFYTSERLSSNLISCICQDQAGYIWIGTEYGLNRYDVWTEQIRRLPFHELSA